MKPSEMTNEMLAGWLETAPEGDGVILHEAMREAAARLRKKITIRTDNAKTSLAKASGESADNLDNANKE